MAIQITIVGLGQIGGSFGLALAEQKESIQRVGHDLNPDVAKKALKLGAVDRISVNLPSAVRGADIVLLALPLDQIRETLEIIADELKEDVVVLDTAPIKKVVHAWMKELLPSKRHYVGLTPVLNPSYLLMPETGIDAARPDLFKQGLLCITTPPGTVAEAVKLATDLTQIVGATNLFVDLLENDSLMAATHLLPQLISAALLNATVDQPGWYEARKFAGRAYAQMTNPSVQFGEPKSVSSSSISDRENVLRVVDEVIAVLQAMRDEIEQDNSQALEERFERARQGRQLWWSQRQAANWDESPAPPQISTGSEVVGRLFGIRPRKKPTPK
jgi:prephenate dehydrogenase